ncbi:APC family permease [Streptomyces sp. NPDC060020]|uniref:APC family permease n=1 Tax=Streptomyces sp. NPDC060020 TaxID=3347038 RepID=UPI00368E1D9C
MAEAPTGGSDRGGDGSVEADVERGGYRQELKRTLGSFQVFAISFAFISVAVGVFGTYDEVLRTAGPVGIWLWLIAAVGQTLVALVVAQFAARIPLSGSSYQWASRLADTRIGWWFGWLTFCYLAIAVLAIDNALASQAFMPLVGIAENEDTARVITLAVLIVQAVVAIASTRLVSWINSAAVGLEVALVVVVAIARFVAVAVTGDGSTANLTSRGIAAHAPDYFAVGGGLMLAMIMGLANLVGFDSAANLAEEAKDPHRSVPRAIVGSVVAAGILGMLFLIALTVSIEDVPRISADGSPVAAIMRENLGPAAEKVLLVAISFAFFGAGIVVMVSCSRLVYAMSRDARFPAHRVMRRVNPRTQTPIPATLLILALGFVLMVALPGAALLELITASTILPAIIYGATIVLYLAVRGRLGRRPGAFDLGRLELPVAICALVWTLLALFVLVTPREALVPVVIVAGLLLLGGLFSSACWCSTAGRWTPNPARTSSARAAEERSRPEPGSCPDTTKRRVTGPSVTRRSGLLPPDGARLARQDVRTAGRSRLGRCSSACRGLCA